MIRTVIVGGGVAGMALALALHDRGEEALVLEREPRPGGKVLTEQVGDWRVELGPAALVDGAPATAALYARLGLSAEVVHADERARRRFVFGGGRLREVPDSPPKILLSRALSLGAKWRILREPRAPGAPESEETVAELARRRLGEEIAGGFVEPMVSGVYAGDWAKLSAASAFPRLVALEREHGSLLRGLVALERARRAAGAARRPSTLTTLRSGMGTLAGALGAALGPSLHLGAETAAIARTAGGFRLRTHGGAELAAERVVLALPPAEAAQLARPIDAPVADAFGAIPSVGVASVSLGFARAALAHPLEGFGFLVPRREGPRLLGAIWMTSIFPDTAQTPPGTVLVRCMLGGAHDPGALALDDTALLEAARAGLATALGALPPALFTHIVRWPHAIPQYEVGHAARVETIEQRGAPLGLHATGAALRGVGVNDVLREAAALAQRLGASTA